MILVQALLKCFARRAQFLNVTSTEGHGENDSRNLCHANDTNQNVFRVSMVNRFFL